MGVEDGELGWGKGELRDGPAFRGASSALQSTLESRLTRALQLPDTGHVVLRADWPQKPPGWLIRFMRLNG